MSEYQFLHTKQFLKREERFLKKHPDIIPQYEKTMQLMGKYPHHPSLRLHRLQGSLQKYHSVSINMKYRVTIEFIIQDKLIIPVMIGSHNEAYQ